MLVSNPILKLKLLTPSSHYGLMSGGSRASVILTLASADSICFAPFVTDHHITVDINLDRQDTQD